MDNLKWWAVTVFFAFAKAYPQQLTGKITDSNNKPLAYINVLLYDKLDDPVYATITRADGSFTIESVAADYYQIEVKTTGYETYRNGLNMPAKNKKLENIILKEYAATLDAVTVTAQKPVVEIQPDKTVLNVESMAVVAGDNALELLRRAPGVRLDNDDNVIVEGRSGVTYYINGRQSYLTGEDLKNFLRSLTADDISTIELITQPSSKYDAAGSGGIININLKSIKGQGLRGSAANTLTLGNLPEPTLPQPERIGISPVNAGLFNPDADAELNPRANTSVNLTYRSSKWDLAANLSNYWGRSTGFLYLYRLQCDKIFDDQTNSIYNGQRNNLNLRTDYRVNDRQTLGANLNLNYSNSDNQSSNRTPLIDRPSQQLDSVLEAPNRSDAISFNLSSNLSYRYADTLGNVFTADLDYGRFIRDTDNLQPNFYRDGMGRILSQDINSQQTAIHIDIYAVKADFETKLWGGNLSTGIKYSPVSTDNDFDFLNIAGNVQTLDPQLSNRFFYDEQIRAAYLNYSFGIISKSKESQAELKAQLGLRVEQTVSKGDLITASTQTDQLVERDYVNLFPSGGLTFKPSWKHSLSLTYSRRIERPNYSTLNPFEFQLNELSSSRGNPFLQPQYIDNLKLSHTFEYKLTTSISYSYINDFFAQITQALPGGRNFLSLQNVADQQIWNLSIGSPVKFTDKWSGYVSGYVTYNDYQATDPSFISID